MPSSSLRPKFPPTSQIERLPAHKLVKLRRKVMKAEVRALSDTGKNPYVGTRQVIDDKLLQRTTEFMLDVYMEYTERPDRLRQEAFTRLAEFVGLKTEEPDAE